MERTTERTKQTSKQTKEWKGYAPINVKPQGGGVGHGVGILTFSLKKKFKFPNPWDKIIGQNTQQRQEKALKFSSNLDQVRSKWSKSLPSGHHVGSKSLPWGQTPRSSSRWLARAFCCPLQCTNQSGHSRLFTFPNFKIPVILFLSTGDIWGGRQTERTVNVQMVPPQLT